MFALRIDLLTGRYVATAYNDRNEAEWPIHPARVYSALVAAHYATDPPDPRERDALEWLERLPAPDVRASEESRRAVVPVFVPVNDTGVLPDFSAALEDLAVAEQNVAELHQRIAASDQSNRRQLERDGANAERALAKERERVQKRASASIEPEEATAAGIATAAAVLPENRGRQPRTFPSVTAVDPVVYLVWREAAPSHHQREALANLARRVTRIGHSSSLVGCRFVDTAPEPNWIASDDGATVLRVVGAGQLLLLEQEFRRHREEQPRTLPCQLQSYRRASGVVASAAAGLMGRDWILFQRRRHPSGSGAIGLPAPRSPDVAGALRDALLKHADQPIREVLSGHRSDGRPSESPHVAFVPLPFVGGAHADGLLVGVALVLPSGVSTDDRVHVLRAVGKWEQAAGTTDPESDSDPRIVPLWMGRAGDWNLQRVEGAPTLRNLDPETWCAASRHWSTVTPIALDRNPGDLRSTHAEEAALAMRRAVDTIAVACEQVGLPRPESVGVSAMSSVRGASGAASFSPFPRKEGRVRRALVHADLTFARPIEGPVLLGAGRYLGMGLCRPLGGRH